MPTETRVGQAADLRDPVATRRILRLALGTSLSLYFSQAMAWQLSFIAPVFTLLLLALPMPAPRLKSGLGLVIVLVVPMMLGIGLLPFMAWIRPIAVLLVSLALFHLFYQTSRDGKNVLGTLLTVSISVVVAVGSVNITALPVMTVALAFNAIAGLAFVWIAFAILPDLPAEPGQLQGNAAPPPPPTPEQSRQLAWRAMVIVLPATLFMLFSPDSPGYMVVMIKLASMGQQASAEQGRKLGMSLIESTAWGGLGAIIGWNLVAMWPSLVFFSLLAALACLLFGRQIFRGPGMDPRGQMWSYALLTMMVLLVPAVSDSIVGSDANAAFWSRLWLIVVIAVYGTAAAAAFDAFWPPKGR